MHARINSIVPRVIASAALKPHLKLPEKTQPSTVAVTITVLHILHGLLP